MSNPTRSVPVDPAEQTPAPPTIITDVPCTACGCLCDDIGLVVAGGRIVEAERACAPGRAWFLADHDQRGLPVATVEGQATEPDEALEHAARILREARAPVVLGLTRTSNEAVTAALEVADRIGASVDIGQAASSSRRLRAIQRVGRVAATLGEVKNRADVVVFWGVDPIVTHPRHWERYSVEPRGRFVPEGRAGRSVIVADAGRTETAARADWFVPIAPERQFEALWTLRALVNGIAVDPRRGEETTGMSPETTREFADRLRGAHYGAWFYGPGLGQGRGGSACIEAAHLLIRDLNTRNRFVILPLGEPGNAAGAESVLTWQTGWAQGVDYSGDVPRSLPRTTSALTRLERGEADAALIVADAVEPWLTESARTHLGRIPRVVIAPRATASQQSATVALAAATSGIDAPGTVTRVDGVVLPLRPALAPSVPTDRELLRNLNRRLKAHPTRN